METILILGAAPTKYYQQIYTEAPRIFHLFAVLRAAFILIKEAAALP
jgi:hypothetical protein